MKRLISLLLAACMVFALCACGGDPEPEGTPPATAGTQPDNESGIKRGGVMVMGGASVYRQLLPYCQNCYITRLEADFEADVYMPDLDRDRDFVLAWESRPQEENGVTYRFTRYERMNDR